MLENYFSKFRRGVVGLNLTSESSTKPILYADWTASGRLYFPIEHHIVEKVGPYVANPHTENTETGRYITAEYRSAKNRIKAHVGATDQDALIATGAGATSAINRLQHLLNIKHQSCRTSNQPPLLERWIAKLTRVDKPARPVIFVSHMEHHSNHTSWNTCDADVVVIERAPDGQPCYEDLQLQLKRHSSRPMKIGAFTACSNVTGIKTDVRRLAKTMHLHGGVCFIDYACSAPYVDINMHPSDPLEQLDAIYFSPHKFLGGPGSSGILVFNKSLYQLNDMPPTKPGGGTVLWTNPWGEQAFFDDIEQREDGGTPPFMQTIRAALSIDLKEQMNTKKIAERETHLRKILMGGLAEIPTLHILEPNAKNRLCIVSFYVENVHHNLIVRLLDDKFGIQSRGGCSCAGTYGHILLNVDKSQSNQIVSQVNAGDLSQKPGWVRLSLHPTNTDKEAHFIVDSMKQVCANIEEWSQEYKFIPSCGDFEKQHINAAETKKRA